MSRARKPKRVAKKPAATIVLGSVQRKLHVAAVRLNRANELLNAIDHIANVGVGEVNLGALAIAARDLLDQVLDDLAPFRRDEDQDDNGAVP